MEVPRTNRQWHYGNIHLQESGKESLPVMETATHRLCLPSQEMQLFWFYFNTELNPGAFTGFHTIWRNAWCLLMHIDVTQEVKLLCLTPRHLREMMLKTGWSLNTKASKQSFVCFITLKRGWNIEYKGKHSQVKNMKPESACTIQTRQTEHKMSEIILLFVTKGFHP